FNTAKQSTSLRCRLQRSTASLRHEVPYMPLRYAILWCLARGIRHGYDIRRALGEMTDGLWDINPGHVYQAFRALERDGLVTLTEIVPQHNLPDRKEYALTPAGQAALAQWIGKPVPAERPTKD